MSKKDQENLGRASHYIRQKDYAAARAILTKMDHPTAKQWLAKLDQIAPIKPKRGLAGLNKVARLGIGLVACIGLVVCLVIGQSVGILPTKTKTVEAENEAARRAMTATNMALTPSSTPTATHTATNTPLPTDTPTVTSTIPTSEPTIQPTSTVRPTNQTRYTTENVNVRAGAGTTYDRLGTLPEGYQLAVVGELTDWYQIEFNNGVGWVAREFTSAHAPSGSNGGGSSNNHTAIPVATSLPQPIAACTCTGRDLDCSDFATWLEAQTCLNYCMATVGSDVYRLDNDDPDVIACESMR